MSKADFIFSFLLRFWVPFSTLQIVSVVSVFSQLDYPKDEQYKKRPTNAIAAIAQGDTDQAIKNLEKYIEDFPRDAESHYCLAVAHSVSNNIPLAMQHMRSAVEAGMPIERIIAGPRDLLRNLVASPEFQKFSTKKNARLIHGPILGDITSTTAKLWMRTDKVSKVTLVFSSTENQHVVEKSAMVNGEGLATLLEIDGLHAETVYTYMLSLDGKPVCEPGTLKTAVEKGNPVHLKIGFGGGAGYTPWFERMWDTLAQQDFTAFLLLGDNVYIDYPEVPEVQEYCYYRRQSRPEFRRLTRQIPIYAIWDDHDFTVNDGEGGPEIEFPSWKRQVWNLFKNQWPNPYYGGEDHPGCWFDFSIGDIDFIMLDCRYYREDPKKVLTPSMLGPFQKAWLKEKLQESTATFKVIASSVPWAKDTKPGSDDTWDGFPGEREEIFSFIEEHRIEGVIFLSADRHRSDAWKIERFGGYDFYEFMSSRLTNIHTHDLMSGSLFGYNKKCSFGSLEFDTTISDPTVSYTIKSIDNEEIHKIMLFRSQLDFKPDKVSNKKGRN